MTVPTKHPHRLDQVAAIAAAVLVLVLTLLIVSRCSESGTARRVDAKWEGAQAGATVAATAAKRVTEVTATAGAKRIEEKVNEGISDVRSRAADLRQRVRQNRESAARRDHLPSAAGAAGQSDAAAGAALVVVQGRAFALETALIDTAEEGDIYREQVIGWQAFWAELVAAWAAGQAVGSGGLERRSVIESSNAQGRWNPPEPQK